MRAAASSPRRASRQSGGRRVMTRLNDGPLLREMGIAALIRGLVTLDNGSAETFCTARSRLEYPFRVMSTPPCSATWAPSPRLLASFPAVRAVTIGDGRLVVREHDDPQPGAGEVLVRVRAAGLNGADMLQRKGGYPPPPGAPQDIPGLELAGEVVSVGPG